MHEKIVMWCQEIKQKGMEPSVALLRAHSNGVLSIPEAISALRTWRKSGAVNNTVEQSSPIPASPETSTEARLAALEAKCTALHDQNIALTQRCEELERRFASRG